MSHHILVSLVGSLVTTWHCDT